LRAKLRYVAGVSYDAALDELLQKAWDGRRIDQGEALALYHLPLEELGALGGSAAATGQSRGLRRARASA
jgi:2-iminoacetate synthase ThiH